MRVVRGTTVSRRSVRAALTLLIAVGVLSGAPLTVLGANAWQLSRTPAGFVAGTTATIRLLVAPGTASADDVGCVTVSIPPVFAVSSVAILAAPAGLTWTVAASGATTVVAHALTGGDRLRGATAQSMTIGVTVSGKAVGDYTWKADADRSQNCVDGADPAKSFTVAILPPPPTPTPPPPPTPSPPPPPPGTPRPTPKPTPSPPRSPGTTPRPDPSPSPAATTGLPSPPSAPPQPAESPQPSPSDSPATESAAPVPSPPGSAGGGQTGPTAGLDRRFTIPGVGNHTRPVQGDLSADLAARFAGALDWAVPGLVLSVPGLLLILAVVAQSFGGLAWLPIVRRRVGGLGVRRRRDGGLDA